MSRISAFLIDTVDYMANDLFDEIINDSHYPVPAPMPEMDAIESDELAFVSFEPLPF